jgi:uncharacterized membrane protein YfcA
MVTCDVASSMKRKSDAALARPGTAFVAGAIVGIFGGLIGLGGAEFRLPLLIGLFALLAHQAVLLQSSG